MSNLSIAMQHHGQQMTCSRTHLHVWDSFQTPSCHAEVKAQQKACHKLCRETLIDALSPLGTLGNGVAGGEGAIYLWAQLPEGEQGACVIA